jgi:hypothetical protein
MYPCNPNNKNKNNRIVRLQRCFGMLCRHKAQHCPLPSSTCCLYPVWSSGTKYYSELSNLTKPRVLVTVVCFSSASLITRIWSYPIPCIEKVCHIISLPAANQISNWLWQLRWILLTRQTFPKASTGNRVANIWQDVTEGNEQRK